MKQHTALFLASFAIGFWAVGVAHAEVFLPPEGKRLLAVAKPLEEFAQGDYWSQQVPGAVVSYTGLRLLAGITEPARYGAGMSHLDALMQRFPDSALILGLFGVTPGRQGPVPEQNIDRLIGLLKRYQRPVYLRFGYEFDGPWNAYDPKEYVAAWKQFRARLRALNAHHVSMVWQSAASCGQTYRDLPIDFWYPGDEEVDWIGLSYFSAFGCGGLASNGVLHFAFKHGKPVMIAEATPRHYDLAGLRISGDGKQFQSKSSLDIWHEWFAAFFNFVERNSDQIRIVTYIDYQWSAYPMWSAEGGKGYWGDSRLDINPHILARWKIKVRDPEWLGGGPGLFERLGYAPGVDSEPE